MVLKQPKNIKTGQAGRAGLVEGSRLVASLAEITFGPRGGHVALERKHDYPELTMDGFGVIKDLEREDRFVTAGIELIKACARETRNAVGDGSTTSALIAGVLAEAGFRLIASGLDPMAVRRRFDDLVGETLDILKRKTIPAADHETLRKVARIASAGDDEAAGLAAEALARLGPDGVVKVSHHQGVDTQIEYMNGMKFDHGLLSHLFLRKADETKVKLDQVYLLMCQGELTKAGQVVPALEAARRDDRSLLVLAENVSGEALTVMLTNHRHSGGVRSAAVKGPGSGIYRHAETDDIAVLTGGQMMGEELGRLPERLRDDELGFAKRVEIDATSTAIFGGGGKDSSIDGRISQIRDEFSREKKSYDRDKLETRLARLVSGVANIRVGSVTETAWKERHGRCENAVNSARAAALHGVCAGCGVALVRAAFTLESAATGENDLIRSLFAKVLQEPFRRIAANAGREPSLAIEALREAKEGIGFDGVTGEFCDYLAAGILDATHVVATALTNANSAAGQIISSDCVVTYARESSPS
jgi:chaperonin GroEL